LIWDFGAHSIQRACDLVDIPIYLLTLRLVVCSCYGSLEITLANTCPVVPRHLIHPLSNIVSPPKLRRKTVLLLLYGIRITVYQLPLHPSTTFPPSTHKPSISLAFDTPSDFPRNSYSAHASLAGRTGTHTNITPLTSRH
jgi:hypothetical protein